MTTHFLYIVLATKLKVPDYYYSLTVTIIALLIMPSLIKPFLPLLISVTIFPLILFAILRI